MSRLNPNATIEVWEQRNILFANYLFVNNKYAQGKEKLTCQKNPTWKP
jgi:hypothetical protein